jgi:hypothetical protein
MVKIAYQLDATWNSKLRLADLEAADEAALRYDMLLGNIVFETDICNFSASWGWIPVVDFVVCLRQILHHLSKAQFAEAAYEFTESDAQLRFERRNGILVISASYAPCKAEVSLNELASAFDQLLRQLIQNLQETFPSLLQNKVLRSLLFTDSGMNL